jgi:hypothetical protein
MSGPIAGVNFDETFAVGARATRFPPFALLARSCDEDGNEYMYVQADGAIAGAGYAVIIDEAGQAAEITNTTGLYGQKVGIAKAAFADNEYGWVQIYGTTLIQVAASCAANVVITTTTTDGQLDDAAGVGTKVIVGAALTTARAASAGTAEGVINYPTVGATN